MEGTGKLNSTVGATTLAQAEAQRAAWAARKEPVKPSTPSTTAPKTGATVGGKVPVPPSAELTKPQVDNLKAQGRWNKIKGAIKAASPYLAGAVLAGAAVLALED